MYPETAGFQKHSMTSRAAAEQCKTINSMEGQILDRLGITEIGWTADELQQHLETLWPNVQAGTVGARLRGLELKGMVVKADRTRPTRTGRKAHEWYLKETADRLMIKRAPEPDKDSPEALRQTIRNLQRANKEAVERAANAELRVSSLNVRVERLEKKLKDLGYGSI